MSHDHIWLLITIAALLVGAVDGYLVCKLRNSGHQGAARARRTSGSHASREVTADPLLHHEYYEATYDALTGNLPQSVKRNIWDGFCARLTLIEKMWR